MRHPMTDPAELARRCEPPEGTEPGTWHWLKADKKGATNAICVPIEWTGRLWRLSPLVSHGAATPTTTWEYGYRYAAPCLPPEAAALIETQAREIAELRAAIVELTKRLEGWGDQESSAYARIWRALSALAAALGEDGR